MSFNLRSIKTVETFQLVIKDEEGNPTPVSLTLAGPNHPVRKAANHAAQRKMMSSAKRTGQVELPDPEESEKDRIKNIAMFTLGWTGYADDTGAPVPFSTEAVHQLYGEPEMKWLVDQVELALGNASLFTKRASSN